MLDKVKPLKLESPDTGGTEEDQFPTSLNQHEDYIECRGLVLASDEPGVEDELVVFSRDGSRMVFKDGENTTPVSLSDLVSGAGGLTYVEFLLECDPTKETGTPDCSYAVTYQGSYPVKEEWFRADSTKIKSIDYTYSGGRITREVRKIYADDGSTVVAQVTWAYTYSGGKIASATMTRDV